MSDHTNMNRALISVSDKAGIAELAQELSKLDFEIISTGGTAKTLKQANIPAVEVSELTGFAEILEGRVKTLHPKIFGGILFDRDNPKHKSDVERYEIPQIDWVIVNLYPFEKIHLENRISKSEMLEFIDIGGVSLLRASGKNFKNVVVLCDQKDYQNVLEEFKQNKTVSIRTRRMLAAKVFAHTAHYDSMIAKFFREMRVTGEKLVPHQDLPVDSDEIFPTELTLGLRKVGDLRYGENPQQKAALYKESGGRDWGVVSAEKIQGKELSFNNFLDLDSAWQIVNSFNLSQGSQHLGVSCAVIKHTNPCGVAIGRNSFEAFQEAFNADPLSAFGGIIGFSSSVDKETAEQISKSFFECVIAPDYSAEALEIFKKKVNLRILRQGTQLSLPYEIDIKKISGGVLVQERDILGEGASTDAMENLEAKTDPASGAKKGGKERARSSVENILTLPKGQLADNWKVVSRKSPTPEEIYSLEFAWKVSKFVKSNAIVLARGTVTYGIGAGQTSRIDSLKSAIQKMKDIKSETREKDKAVAQTGIRHPTTGIDLPLVMASDAFFPFRDCIDISAKAGVMAIIQPGGSIRDQESIDAANELNVAMIFTGVRHFRH